MLTSAPMARTGSPEAILAPDFLVRMLVFLILCALVLVVLYKQIIFAFMANPGLNGLIVGALIIGILLAFRQVIRLFPEVNWVNSFRLADPGLAVERPPVLLAPMAALLGDRMGRMAISSTMMRGILDSIATRLDEARDLSRYMTGLAHLSRPARHVLGSDRHRRFRWPGDPGTTGWRRRGRDVRLP